MPHSTPTPVTRLRQRKNFALRYIADVNAELRDTRRPTVCRSSKAGAFQELADVNHTMALHQQGTTLCQACDGELERRFDMDILSWNGRVHMPETLATVQVCKSCGGVHVSGYREGIQQVVKIGHRFEMADTDAPTYFHAKIVAKDKLGTHLDTVHGWFDRKTGQVTQYG